MAFTNSGSCPTDADQELFSDDGSSVSQINSQTQSPQNIPDKLEGIHRNVLYNIVSLLYPLPVILEFPRNYTIIMI